VLMRPITLRGSAMVGLRHLSLTRSRNIILPSNRDPDGMFRHDAGRPDRDGLQHQPGEKETRRHEASGTCSIQNGWERSSNLIPHIAATALSRDLPDRSRARLGSIWQSFSRQKVIAGPVGERRAKKKIAIGERAIMADGNEYTLLMLKEAGQPVDVVLPRSKETPCVAIPSAIFVSAPNPNAARLLQIHLFSRTAQQLLVDFSCASIRPPRS